MCSLVVNGVPHGPDRGTTVCQLHMRRFKDGDTITIEPWRAKAFPVVKDLVVDRSAFDRIIAAGGYVSVNCGGAPDGNASRFPKDVSEAAMDSAACIGCGALRRGVQERVGAPVHEREDLASRAAAAGPVRSATAASCAMIEQADAEGFGSCSNEGECEAVCPKEIPISNIARTDREPSRHSSAPANKPGYARPARFAPQRPGLTSMTAASRPRRSSRQGTKVGDQL